MRQAYIKVAGLASVYSIGSISQSVLSLFLLPLYTRYLSIADYGVLALLEITIRLITRLIDPPIDNGLNRFYYKPEYRPRNGVLLFNLFLLLIAKSLLAALLYWYSTDLLVRVLFNGNGELRLVVQAYGILLLIAPLSAFVLVYVRLKEMARFYVFLSFSNVILSAVGTIYLLVHLKLGVLAVVYGQVFGSLILVIVGLPILLKAMVFQLSPSVMKEPLKFSYPLTFSGYANMLLDSGDRYVLNLFTSVSSVGLYSFGYKVAILLNTVLVVPVNLAIYPSIYKKENEPAQQKEFISTSTTYYYFVGIFMGLGLSMLAREAIMLLAAQREYWSAWVVVPLLAFSYIQLGLGRFFKWGALLRNKSYHLSAMALVSALVNLGLNFIVIPKWGILGAAFTTLVSYCVWNALSLYYSIKFYDLHFELGRLGHITVVGIALYLLSLGVANGDSLASNIVIKLLLLASYPFIFFLTGFFVPAEKAYMQDLLLKTYTKIKAIGAVRV